MGWAVVAASILAAVVGASAFFDGYYDVETWAAIGFALSAALAALVVMRPAILSRPELLTLVGAFGLAGWAALSLLWAQSGDRAWTEANRMMFYAIILTLAIAVTRNRAAARRTHAVLAIISAVFAVSVTIRLLAPGATGLFLEGRLTSPLGYVNGEAGFLLMAFWLLLGFAEPRGRPAVRGLALAGAVLCAELTVLTQARAVVPAAIAAVVAVLALVPGRTHRAVMLAIAAGATAAGLPFLLDVYNHRPPGQLAPVSASTAHRAGLAAMLIALVAGLIWAAASSVRQSRDMSAWHRPIRTVLVAALGIAVLVTAVWGKPVSRAHRAYDQFVAVKVDQNIQTRFTDAGGFRYDLWRVAVREWNQRPLLGLGAGNYDTQYYQLRRNPSYVRQPHSIELQLLAELGIPGLLLFLLIAGAVVRAAVRARARLAEPGELGLLVAAAGAVVVWVVDTSVDWLYNLPGVTGIAIVLAGTVLARGAPPGRDRPLSFASASRRRQAATVAALALVAVAAASLGRQYVATRYLNAATADASTSPRVAIMKADSALRLAPGSMEAAYAKAAAQAQLDEYGAARSTLETAARLEPSNPVPHVLLGDLASRRGLNAVAARDYRRAAALAPGDPEVVPLAAAATRTAGK
jgi:O-antigen ligase